MGSLEGEYVETSVGSQLLSDPVSQYEDEESGALGRVIYRASFTELENRFVNYYTVQYLLISLLLIFVYGVGILMLLYVPIRRYIVRKDIQSRKLYVTTNAIVYKVTRPVFLPCFGVSKREKHILLHLVTDVVIEQGCLQSSYGVSSVKIEGMAIHNRPTDDVRIQGITNPILFQKVVLNAASNLRKDHRSSDGQNASTSEESRLYETLVQESLQGYRQSQAWRQTVAGLNSWQVSYAPYVPPLPNNDNTLSGEDLLRKLEGIEASVKRLEILIESRFTAQSQ